MNIQCKNCGHINEVKGIGRKRLNVAGKNVYATLRVSSSATEAAQNLKVSRGWVNNWIKQQMGIKLMTRSEFLAEYMPKGKR